MIIYHNLSALYAHRQLRATDAAMQKSIEKLSSGLRINRAGDDASGLAVSERMRSQIRGLLQSVRNAEDGISFVQTSEGALQEVQDMLHRVRELAIQAANGVYSSTDRQQVQVEVSQLMQEIDRIGSTTQFNGMYMLRGQFANAAGATGSLWFHVGANAWERVRAYISTMSAQALGLSSVQINTVSLANQSLANIDSAVNQISQQRANLGALQNRLEHTVNSLAVGAENLQAAESRIRDTDMAREVVDFTRSQILMQSGIAMLAQANLKPQSVLQLLA